MQALFTLMSRQHGVASTAQARGLGVSRRVERRLLAEGTVRSPCPGILTAGGAPLTFHRRAMAAALSSGVAAVSHGAAARLHGLDGFERHETVDVLGVRGANPHQRIGVLVHRTRGDLDGHTTTIDGIPVLTVGATLALLAPAVGIGPTATALDSALRAGATTDELTTVAEAWRRRGRAGPPVLLMLLAERRLDQALPRSWFQRLADRVLAHAGVRLLTDYVVRDGGGAVLGELDLADPDRRVGVAQHHDARGRGMLRRLGWEIVDVWWSDLGQPERVIAELTYLLASRTPNRPSVPARRGR